MGVRVRTLPVKPEEIRGAGNLADAPTVRRLSGILSQDASVEDYHKYLEEKYDDQA